MELKQNSSIKVPVRLRAVVDGSALSGVTFAQVVIYIQKHGGVSAVKPVGPVDWVEIDPVNMPGEYDLLLSAGDVDTVGFFKYFVSFPGISLVYPGLLQIVTNIESDTFDRIGAPVAINLATDLQNAISNIKGSGDKDLTQVDTDVTGGISTIQGDLANIAAQLARALALSYDNVVEDTQVYDANGKLTSSRVLFYDTAAHAILNDGVTGLLYQYLIASTYDAGSNCTLFRMTRNP